MEQTKIEPTPLRITANNSGRVFCGPVLFSRFAFVALAALAALVALSGLTGCGNDPDVTPYLELNKNYSVNIERDERGVPHVIGEKDVDTAFGFAYAQAEDNWSVLQETLATNRRVRAKSAGQDAAITDFIIHWMSIWETLEISYEKDLKQSTRDYVEAFADGLNFYAATHPESTNLDLLPVSGKDIVAGYMFRHTMFYGLNSVLKEITGPERAKDVSGGKSVAMAVNGKSIPIGSNAIAVAASYSTDGATRIAINAHQPTVGPVAWYEAHIKSGEGMDILGGLFPGTPTIGLGYTKNLAWAVTVNKPDLVDVYVLDIDPNDPMRYRIDGEWRELESREVEIGVLLWGFLPWTSTETVLRSVHGPVLETEHGTYAVRYAGMDEVRQIEQWMAMNRATNFAEWRKAMQIHAFSSFNFVYADKDDNIMFVHNSQTPLRKEGHDWQQYLPGDDSSLIWDEVMKFDELPQVINPVSGYVHSANQTPFMVSATGDNPDPEKYSKTAGFQTRVTNRTNRGLELLDELGPISEKEFSAIKHDKTYSTESRAAKFLQRIIGLNSTGFEQKYRDAQQIVSNWNLSTDVDNTDAPLGVCMISKEWEAEQRGKPFPEPEGELKRCTDLMLSSVGKLDPPWGQVNRHVRGDVNVAVGGGPDTLRAIYGRGLEEDGYLTNLGGDGLYYLVSWDKNGKQKARGVHHFGSATEDKNSKHYADQATDFANEILHDPLLDDADRAAHIVRRYQPGEE